jgi:hypothetical protein
VVIDLCRAAGAKCLALFHHEPTFDDAQILAMHRDAITYERLTRGDAPPLDIICAYDGLEVRV